MCSAAWSRETWPPYYMHARVFHSRAAFRSAGLYISGPKLDRTPRSSTAERFRLNTSDIMQPVNMPILGCHFLLPLAFGFGLATAPFFLRRLGSGGSSSSSSSGSSSSSSSSSSSGSSSSDLTFGFLAVRLGFCLDFGFGALQFLSH